MPAERYDFPNAAGQKLGEGYALTHQTAAR